MAARRPQAEGVVAWDGGPSNDMPRTKNRIMVQHSSREAPEEPLRAAAAHSRLESSTPQPDANAAAVDQRAHRNRVEPLNVRADDQSLQGAPKTFLRDALGPDSIATNKPAHKLTVHSHTDIPAPREEIKSGVLATLDDSLLSETGRPTRSTKANAVQPFGSDDQLDRPAKSAFSIQRFDQNEEYQKAKKIAVASWQRENDLVCGCLLGACDVAWADFLDPQSDVFEFLLSLH
jgi:hypothetical protein